MSILNAPVRKAPFKRPLPRLRSAEKYSHQLYPEIKTLNVCKKNVNVSFYRLYSFSKYGLAKHGNPACTKEFIQGFFQGFLQEEAERLITAPCVRKS